MKITALAFVVLASIATGSAAQSAPRLLVANQGDHTLSVVDVEAGKQVAVIPVGGVTGHEVAVSPDGKLAYVPIYGDSGVGRPGTDGSSMSVIDIAGHKVVRAVDLATG